MKSAIVQLDYYDPKNFITPRYQLLYDYCVPSVKEYAKMYNIDHILIKKDYKPKSSFYTQYKSDFYYYLHKHYLNYDAILYLDLDILVINYTNNVFLELFKPDCAITVAKANEQQRLIGIEWLKQHNFNNYPDMLRPNACVLMFNTKLSSIFFNEQLKINIDSKYYVNDEPYLMHKIEKFNMPVHYLDDESALKWNYRNTRSSISQEEFKNLAMKQNIHFIHWASSVYDDSGNDRGDATRRRLEDSINWHLTALKI